jgi:hypothetical protein
MSKRPTMTAMLRREARNEEDFIVGYLLVGYDNDL